MLVPHTIETVSELNEKILEAQQELNKAAHRIIELADYVVAEFDTADNWRLWNNCRIARRVIYHIARGLTPYQAQYLTAEEYGVRPHMVQILFQFKKQYLTALNLYARTYFAQKFKKDGKTAKEIAKLLSISENHVYRLLKIDLENYEIPYV